MAVLTRKMKHAKLAESARSPLVKAILENLDGKSWTPRADLVEKVGHLIPTKDAIAVCEYRVPASATAARNTKIARGRTVQVMLTCITLVQTEKIEQRGRGVTKEYRLK